MTQSNNGNVYVMSASASRAENFWGLNGDRSSRMVLLRPVWPAQDVPQGATVWALDFGDFLMAEALRYLIETRAVAVKYVKGDERVWLHG